MRVMRKELSEICLLELPCYWELNYIVAIYTRVGPKDE
jgi:hypothetical protein